MAGVVKYDSSMGEFSDLGSFAYAESAGGDYALATASTNTSLNFESITTATAFYIKSDQAISVNINSNTETAKSLTAGSFMLSVGTSVTALYITNSSGSTANIKWRIWGA